LAFNWSTQVQENEDEKKPLVEVANCEPFASIFGSEIAGKL